MIEPTETETKEQLDEFVRAMTEMRKEAQTDQRMLTEAPHCQYKKRLDEVKAARELDLVWKPDSD